jgi:hypothetical protein
MHRALCPVLSPFSMEKPEQQLMDAQMQGARNPKEYKTLGRSCGKFYRKNDQTFFVPLQRRRMKVTTQMGVFQQPANLLLTSLTARLYRGS